jgi:hypothetical protein
MRLILIVMSMFLISIISDAKAQYQGNSITSVIQQYGSPDLKIVMRSGNTRYVYNIPYKNPNMPPRTSTAIVAIGPHGQAIGANLPSAEYPVTYPLTKCTLIFDVNKQNVVVSESSHGNCN